jgi:hypothetical protein
MECVGLLEAGGVFLLARGEGADPETVGGKPLKLCRKVELRSVAEIQAEGIAAKLLTEAVALERCEELMLLFGHRHPDLVSTQYSQISLYLVQECRTDAAPLMAAPDAEVDPVATRRL